MVRRGAERVWIAVPAVLAAGLAIAFFVINIVLPLASGPDRSITALPDTAGPATGGAAELTDSLRSLGYACSDEGIDPRMISRQCSASRFRTLAAVTFAGPADTGEVQRISARISASLDDAQTVALTTPVVDAVTAALDMDDASRLAMTHGLLHPSRQKTDVGRWFIDANSMGFFEVVADRWRPPTLTPAVIAVDLDRVAPVMQARGYACKTDDGYVVECTMSKGETRYQLGVGGTDERLSTVISSVWTDDGRSQRLAIAQTTHFLEDLAEPHATTLARWLGVNAHVAGANDFVAGMDLTLDTNREDTDTSISIMKTCWTNDELWQMC